MWQSGQRPDGSSRGLAASHERRSNRQTVATRHSTWPARTYWVRGTPSTEAISRVVAALLTTIGCTGLAMRPVSTGAALAASLPRVFALSHERAELASHATQRPHAELAQQLQVSRWLAFGLRAGSVGADAPGARCRSAPGWPSIPLTASRQRACP